MPCSALAEPLRYAQSAWLGRVPMGCGPAYAAVTPPGGNLNAARHVPPLHEAVAATAGAGVLRLEHGMPAHRRLLPVVRRFSGRETRSDEVLAMAANRLDAFLGDVIPIRYRQVKTGTELRLRQPGECGIVCVGYHDSRWLSRLRSVRHPGSRASMSAWNSGPWPCAIRWVSSWTTTYSTSSRGVPASINE